jgi:hypothetical protein
MIRGRIAHRRRTAAALATVVLVALAIGVSQAFAGRGTATAPIQKHNGACGADIGTQAIGSVTFTRIDKTTLRIALRLDGALPSWKYEVFLFNGGCDILADLGKAKTDSSGQGNWTWTTSTFGNQSFFLDPFDGTFANDSPTVKVGG